MILVVGFGLPRLALLPLLGLVIWSRVTLGGQTPAQAIGGADPGTLIAAAVFSRQR